MATPAPASAFSPRLVRKATSTATAATPAATSDARLMPETKVSWATSVILAAICSGVPSGTGAMPCCTAWAVSSSWAGVSAGSPASVQLPARSLSTLEAITAPSTAVPRLPPICIAACWRPPATPDSSIGALPTMTSVAPTMTGARPRPRSANHTDIATLPVSVSSVDMPYMATAVHTMPPASGTRGPNLVIIAPASGEATIIIAVSGSRCRPASTGLMPCTFWR